MVHILTGHQNFSGGIYIRGYEWDDTTLLGPAITCPTAEMTNQTNDIDYNEATGTVVCVNNANPKLFAYTWNNGFGPRLNNAPGITVSVSGSSEITSTGDAIIYSNAFTPFLHAWHYSSSGFGTKYANPATLGGALGNLALSHGDDAVSLSNHPLPAVWAWDSTTGFGTKFAAPGDFPGATSVRASEFAPNDTHIIFALSADSTYRIYEWDSVTGFGTYVTSPSIVTGSAAYEPFIFSKSGEALIITTFDPSPYIHAYAWSALGLGVKYSNPSIASLSTPFTSAISPSGKHIVVGGGALVAYPWDDTTGFGVRVTTAAVAGSNTIYTIEFAGISNSFESKMRINISDAWKEIASMKVNISDEWKEIASMKINISDEWKELI